MRSYATVADLAAYLDADDMPASAQRLLRDATVLVDRLLMSSLYDVDADDMPTDPRHVAAVRDAVCEQVHWWTQTGDPYGARAAFGSVHIGSISLSGPSAGSRQAQQGATRISPQAIAILENAGLLGQPPVLW